jgi:elongation factor G
MDQDSNKRKLRNIGIIAHIDAGKTTLTERILYYTGRTHKIGEVHDGEATMDFMPEEQDRGITIMSAVTSCEWRGYSVNIIDTPGHVDFTIEVERSLRVLDGAVGVFCAVGGVQPQSETVWRQADRYGVPKLAFINKIDRTGADFDRALSEMKEKLSASPLPITRPAGEEENFRGVIDVLKEKFYTFDDKSLGAEMTEAPIPEDLIEETRAHRRGLIETVAETDDSIMESYLADEEISLDRLIAAIRDATIKLKLVPVFAGAALRNKGVQPLLDGVCDFLPSPMDLPPVKALSPKGGEVLIYPKDEDPLAALVFKIQMMDQGRKLSFVRVYGGVMREGLDVLNPRSHKKDKVARLFKINAGKRDHIEKASAGDLVGVVGLRSAITGDTLSSENRPVLLESIQAADPVISVAVEPINAGESGKLLEALGKLTEEDPTFKLKQDQETGQTIISGMGELHLDVLIHRLAREYGVTPARGKPQVVKRETITKVNTAEGSFVKQLSSGAQAGECGATVSVSPLKRGSGTVIKSQIDKDDPTLSQNLKQAAVDTLRDSLSVGPISGYPLLDLEITLLSLNPGPSGADEPTVRIAVSQAVRKAIDGAGPTLMEPIMKLEVTSPEKFMSGIMGDIGARGGHVENLNALPGGYGIVDATIPLSRVLDYSTSIRSQTQGRGSFLMSFDHFDIVRD